MLAFHERAHMKVLLDWLWWSVIEISSGMNAIRMDWQQWTTVRALTVGLEEAFVQLEGGVHAKSQDFNTLKPSNPTVTDDVRSLTVFLKVWEVTAGDNSVFDINLLCCFNIGQVRSFRCNQRSCCDEFLTDDLFLQCQWLFLWGWKSS